MKKYLITLIALGLVSFSLNAQRTTDNPALKSKSEVEASKERSAEMRQKTQEQSYKISTGYPQYVFISVTENFAGKITDIEVTGEVSYENVEIKTREDKMKIHASMEATEALQKANSINEIFKIANGSFTFESHNVVQIDKALKHYILFSTK